jgi:undecaprenyl diphosphate synthase
MSQKTPKTVGIILDGNRRWAKERGMPTLEGHRRGMNNIEPVVLALRDRGVEHVPVFAFSTENWNRSETEVTYLMQLFEEAIKDKLSKLNEEGVAVRFVGQRERFAQKLQIAMRDVEAKNSKTPRTTLWVCLSYGGRAEVVEAAQALVRKGSEITEESIATHLWTADMPDADIIIRTSGEHRLSNFLLWKSAYAELFFPDVFWPDFSEKDIDTIFAEFATRERRHGK